MYSVDDCEVMQWCDPPQAARAAALSFTEHIEGAPLHTHSHRHYIACRRRRNTMRMSQVARHPKLSPPSVGTRRLESSHVSEFQ